MLQYDEFVADPRGVYQQVLAHIGVPDDGRTTFPKVNVSKDHKFQWLAQWMINPPRWLVRARNLAFGTRWWGTLHGLRDVVLEKLSVPPRTRTLSPEFRRELVAEFEEEISLVEDLLGQRLPHWRAVDNGRAAGKKSAAVSLPPVEAPLGSQAAL